MGVGKRPRLALLFFSMALLLHGYSHANSIRSVSVTDNEIIRVKTALGYSTILEFTSRPISAVLGDQDAFKLEYVGKSITIKPLIPRAKSNLFVFTEFEHFNCQIVTGPSESVDYIIRIRAKEPSIEGYTVSHTGAEPVGKTTSMVMTRIQKTGSYDGFSVTVTSTLKSRGPQNPRSVMLIEFDLRTKKKPYAFQPASLGVKQSGRFINLESMYLDHLEITPGGQSVHGKIALLAQDFNSSKPVTLVFAVPDRKSEEKTHRIEVTTVKTAAKKNGNTDGKGK